MKSEQAQKELKKQCVCIFQIVFSCDVESFVYTVRMLFHVHLFVFQEPTKHEQNKRKKKTIINPDCWRWRFS